MTDQGESGKFRRAGNELEARTAYQLFLEKEAVPVLSGFHIEDLNQVELHPSPRLGGCGVYLNLSVHDLAWSSQSKASR